MSSSHKKTLIVNSRTYPASAALSEVEMSTLYFAVTAKPFFERVAPQGSTEAKNEGNSVPVKQMMSILQHCQEYISKIIYTVELLQQVKENYGNQSVQKYVDEAKVKATWIWKELSKEPSEASETEKNLEQRMLSLARRTTALLVHDFILPSLPIAALPQPYREGLHRASRYATELCSQFDQATNAGEATVTVLSTIRVKLSALENLILGLVSQTELNDTFAYIKEVGSIDYIAISSQEPYNMAVTCSAKVQIYSTANNSLHSSLSHFTKTAYGGTFRKDGKLLVAGSEDGFLRLFELQSHKMLSVFKGHNAATHRCSFTMDGDHIVSFSDDKSVALWDIPTETKLKSFENHKDYIRAGTVFQASQDIFISGSYDHTVKMYDARTGSSVMSVDHGFPVESVLMFPSGGLFISAGGTNIKVWDPIAGRLLCQVSQHDKTITCMCFASDGRHLMSGSLDRHVKIYDVTSYEMVHTLNYSSPIMSVSAAPQDGVVAVGMIDGLLSIRHQKNESVLEDTQKRTTYYQNCLHGTDFKQTNADVLPEKKIVLKYKKFLNKLEFTRALDTVLQEHIQRRHPEITYRVFMELLMRGSLKTAMAGREGDSLMLLVKFVTKYIGDPRFMRSLIDVGRILIELYGPKLNDPETKKQFQLLSESLENQVKYMKELNEIQGIIQTILLAHT